MSKPSYEQPVAGRWVTFVYRQRCAVVVLSLMLTVASLLLVMTRMGMNTDTSDMLAADLDFRQNSIALSEAFPQFSDNIVVVIDGGTLDQVHDAAAELAEHLRTQPSLFGDVFDPQSDPFFLRNGLLYLDLEDLEVLTERLVDAQPFLGKLAQEASLPQLFGLLGLVLDDAAGEGQQLPGEGATNFLNAVSAALESETNGAGQPLAWRAVLSAQRSPEEDARRVLLIQPRSDYGSLQPGTEAMNGLQMLFSELDLAARYGVRVRLTGSLALTQEELASVVDGLGLAGILSLTLVLLLLVWGLRSLPLVASTLITLVAGLIWTAGFATLAIGTLNLISVAFAVLFIGLSVDFGIHYALRYQEERNRGDETPAALANAASKVGGALGWAAVAAAIGFYSFLPTDYQGLAELGLIAGSGMFIALFANLTLLPALIGVLPRRHTPRTARTNPSPTHAWLVTYRRPILLVACVLGVLSIVALPRASFDFDPLNLKDPETESVSTLFDLISSDRYSPYSITVLAPDLESADRLSIPVAALPEVEGTSTFSDLVPGQQEDKLDVIQTASFILSPALSTNTNIEPQSTQNRLSAIAELRAMLTRTTDSSEENNVQEAATRLERALSDWERSEGFTEQTLDRMTYLLLSSLPNRLEELRLSLLAEPFGVADLPPGLRERQVATDGRARLDVYPSGDMRNRAALAEFVNAVRDIAPNATDSPVTILEAGNTVIRAFVQAAVTTIVLIGLLVLLHTRDVRQIVLIFSPLILAAALSVASTVVLGMSFNFANVIVLPLLFGLGIAGSIHMVRREHDVTSASDLMNTSTPRAVTFSALTTIGSFGSIALSSHPGTASMGVLLTIAITLTMLSTLVVLPALMNAWPSRSQQD